MGFQAVFVFGSNLAGRHGAGAAKYAVQAYGAIYGVGEGRQGQSYAVPTKDGNLRTLALPDIEAAVQRFARYAAEHHDEAFVLTPIGCGLAGHKPQDIWAILHRVKMPTNVVLHSSWVNDHAMPKEADLVAAPTTGPDWVGFGKAAMEVWPHGDLDGFALQDLAEKHGLIRKIPGGFDPEKHEDVDGVCPEPGDDWYGRTYEPAEGVAGVPAPAPTVQEAAKVLLDADEAEKISLPVATVNVLVKLARNWSQG